MAPTATRFFETLRADAFSDPGNVANDIDGHGWVDGHFESEFTTFLSHCASRPVTIIEVGTWKGASACRMASISKSLGIPARILCVDTWLGAPEFWTWGIDDPTRGLSLRKKNGYPTVYETFRTNILAQKHEDVIAPLPLSSIQAAEVLTHYDWNADLVYVDAAHEEAAVRADLHAYWPLVKPGGTMFGDDYTEFWDGVRRAVTTFASSKNLEVRVAGSVWSLQKPT